MCGWVGGPLLDQALTPCTLANHQQRLQVVRGQSKREIIPCFWLLGFDREKILIWVKTRITHFLLHNFKTGVKLQDWQLEKFFVVRKTVRKKLWSKRRDYEHLLRNMNERYERYINDMKDVLTLNRTEGIHAVVPANWSFSIITSYI